MHNASKTNLPFINIFKISDEKKLQENTSKSLQVLEVCIHNNSLSKQNKFVLFYITAVKPLVDSLYTDLHTIINTILSF